jgi:hypothetical protein
MDAVREARRYRFGTFEFDAALLELRHGARKVRLRPQSPETRRMRHRSLPWSGGVRRESVTPL